MKFFTIRKVCTLCQHSERFSQILTLKMTDLSRMQFAKLKAVFFPLVNYMLGIISKIGWRPMALRKTGVVSASETHNTFTAKI